MILVHLEESLLDLLSLIDLKYFRMATDDDFDEGPLDLAIVEGAVTNEEEALTLKKIRKASRTLIAAGACATSGGIPAMKNPTLEGEIERAVYPVPETIRSGKAFGVGEYVPVDICLHGCPVVRSELANALLSLALRIPPYTPRLTVCAECKMNGAECLFTNDKDPCMGPTTRGGCGAICPANRVSCEGCRGPLVGTNLKALALAWKREGIPEETLTSKIGKYSMSPSEGK